MSYVGLSGYAGMMPFLIKKIVTNPLQVILLTGHWLRAWANMQKPDQKKSMLAGSDRLEVVAKQILSAHGWRFSPRISID